MEAVRIVRVGGSLLTWDGLRPALRRFLKDHEQTRNIVTTGGGPGGSEQAHSSPTVNQLVAILPNLPPDCRLACHAAPATVAISSSSATGVEMRAKTALSSRSRLPAVELSRGDVRSDDP